MITSKFVMLVVANLYGYGSSTVETTVIPGFESGQQCEKSKPYVEQRYREALKSLGSVRRMNLECIELVPDRN